MTAVVGRGVLVDLDQDDAVVGTVLVVLLQSVLAVMQMPDAGRQIIYGLMILGMLLLYGRGRRAGA